MLAWILRQLRAFEATYDPVAATASSAPAGTAFSAISLALVLGAVGYVPYLATRSGFEGAWVGMLLALAGGWVTYVAWRYRCRGPIGSAATLLDNTFYAGALFYAACRSNSAWGMPLAGIEFVILCALPAQVYGLSPQLAVVTSIPGVLALAFGDPEVTVALVIVTGHVVYYVVAYVTLIQRRAQREQLRLREAVGATRALADESMQTALGSMLLGLGHFLHELKNHQTAVRANLAFIEETATLDEDARAALDDALASQSAQQVLIRETLDGLQAKAKRASTEEFELGALLTSLAAQVPAVRVEIDMERARVLLRGERAHMAVVLTNLIRNAEQAGAKVVRVMSRLEPSGRAVRIVVEDDGPGVAAERRATLFEPFGSSTKPDGTGLGLYLCRRYVELVGGTIAIEDAPDGGASFVVVVPGRLGDAANDEA